MTYAPRRCKISLRANDLGKGAQPLLVRFENGIERILRSGNELGRRFLLAQSGLEIGVSFPNFTHCAVARSGKLTLGAAQFGFCHVHLAIAGKAVEDRHTRSEKNSVSRSVISEIGRVSNAD